jgi:hypothetical protein
MADPTLPDTKVIPKEYNKSKSGVPPLQGGEPPVKEQPQPTTQNLSGKCLE